MLGELAELALMVVKDPRRLRLKGNSRAAKPDRGLTSHLRTPMCSPRHEL